MLALWGLVAMVFSGAAVSPLTLREAIEGAVSRHEDPQIARERVRKWVGSRREVLARVLPHARIDLELIRGTVTRDPQGIQRSDLTARGSLQTTALDPGFLPAYWAADERVGIARLEAREAQRLVAFGVAESFLAALTSAEVLAAARHRELVANSTVDDARRRLEAGVGRPRDLTRARLERSTARLAVLLARDQREQARLVLARNAGAPPTEFVGRRLRAPPPLVGARPVRSELRQQGLGNRVEMRIARRARRSAAWSRWANLLEYAPALQLFAHGSRTNDERLSGLRDRALDWSVGAQLSWRLFAGGARLGRDLDLQADERIARLAGARDERYVVQEIDAAFAEFALATQMVGEATAQVELSSANLEQSRTAFVHGLATALERIESIGQAFAAEAGLAQRRLAVRLAELRLLRAAGMWPLDGADADAEAEAEADGDGDSR